MRKGLLLLSLLSLLISAACGGSGDDIFKEGSSNAGPTVPRTATLTGKIIFDGMPPMPKKISTSSDPGCMNPNLTTEEYVVSDGGLQNVIISVSKGAENMNLERLTNEVLLDQQGCHYIPHALTLQVNQPLKIRNDDNTAHNIHAWAEVNTPFNESQPSKGVETIKRFDKPEMLLPVRCDVHNWMNAFVGVFSHPLHTVSGPGGAYELKLPAGTFEITAQHESLGIQTQMVTVTDGGTAELNFTFKPK